MLWIGLIKKILIFHKKSLQFNKIIWIKKIWVGAANVVYLCQTDNKSYIIKLNLSKNEDFKNEYTVLKFLEKKNLNISPKAYFEWIFENKTYIIQDFVEGTSLEKKLNNNQIVLMADFYSTIHNIKFKKNWKLPNPDKINYSLKSWIEYAEAIYSQTTPKDIGKKIYDKYKDLLEKSKSIITKTDLIFRKEKQFSLRHGDANPNNFILVKNKIIAIDRVWWSVDHPAKEIADFFNKANLTESWINLFYKHYINSNKFFKYKVDIHLVRSYISTAAWHIERILKININSLDRKLYKSKRDEIQEIIKQIDKLEKII